MQFLKSRDVEHYVFGVDGVSKSSLKVIEILRLRETPKNTTGKQFERAILRTNIDNVVLMTADELKFPWARTITSLSFTQYGLLI